MADSKRIVVVGYARQSQTRHQIETLAGLGAELVNIDPYGQEGCYGELVWCNERVTWKGHDISPERVQGVLVCAQAAEVPYQHAFSTAAGSGWTGRAGFSIRLAAGSR
ncbi:MAG: hypothetical protein R3E95_16765 [Thiolinea sp.]